MQGAENLGAFCLPQFDPILSAEFGPGLFPIGPGINCYEALPEYLD